VFVFASWLAWRAAAIAQPRATLQGHDYFVDSATFSKDGAWLATTAGTNVGDHVIVWDVAKAKRLVGLAEFQDRVSSATFSPDAKTLATSGRHDPVRLYDTGTWKVRTTLPGTKLGTMLVAFAPDSSVLATLSSAGIIGFWDPASGKELPGIDPPVVFWSLRFSPDGKTVAAGGWLQVSVFDFPERKLRGTLTDLHGVARNLAFSPDSKLLVVAEFGTGPKRTALSVWDIQTCKLRYRLDLDNKYNKVHDVAIAPDGKTLATVGDGGPLRLWDLANGKHLADIKGGAHRAQAVAFSPDGQTLAVGELGGAVLLFDVPKELPGQGKEM
jgi:WD40 repeat protein